MNQRVTRDRFTNTMLFVLLAILGVSGVVMLYGAWLPWLFDLHRIAGFSLIAILPWKAGIVVRSLSRGLGRTFDRGIAVLLSLLLALFVLLVLFLGAIWMARAGPYSSLGQTMIAWHWIIGLLVLPLLAFHLWRRWPRPRSRDILSRRSFLKLFGAAGAGILLGELAARAADARASAGQPRRFTGSRGFGLFAGNRFPITGEATVEVDPRQWRLALSGAGRMPSEFTYGELLTFPPRTATEVLDCTSGWYSIQDWQGIPLFELLEMAGIGEPDAGVRLVSVTGYHHAYPLAEARTILLATHVTGEVLEPRHGFPLRAVVPGRRGWFWVKWLAKIELLDDPLQVAAGMLASPGQTLRQW